MEESVEMQKPNLDPKTYLDYMDKEMTFCGIITTFCLASVLFMMDKFFTLENSSHLRYQVDFKSAYFVFAIISFIVSAFLLFKLRANLAHHYGQISLEMTLTGFTGKSIENWLREVDAWKFWYSYFYGITFIVCAIIQLGILISITLFKENSLSIFLKESFNSCFLGISLILISILGGYVSIKINSQNETT